MSAYDNWVCSECGTHLKDGIAIEDWNDALEKAAVKAVLADNPKAAAVAIRDLKR